MDSTISIDVHIRLATEEELVVRCASCDTGRERDQSSQVLPPNVRGREQAAMAPEDAESEPSRPPKRTKVRQVRFDAAHEGGSTRDSAGRASADRDGQCLDDLYDDPYYGELSLDSLNDDPYYDGLLLDDLSAPIPADDLFIMNNIGVNELVSPELAAEPGPMMAQADTESVDSAASYAPEEEEEEACNDSSLPD